MTAEIQRQGLNGRDRWFILVLGLIYMFNFIDRTIISVLGEAIRRDLGLSDLQLGLMGGLAFSLFYAALGIPLARLAERYNRSEEHTSELQSLMRISYAVFCLKKKKLKITKQK